MLAEFLAALTRVALALAAYSGRSGLTLCFPDLQVAPVVDTCFTW